MSGLFGEVAEGMGGSPNLQGAMDVLAAFARLGLTSFGGPIAHLGYFREAFVVRRRWLDEQGFGDLVALCQFLPGPASSQVAFAIGLRRAGALGALAAWTGFTLPSAAAMAALGLGAAALQGPLAEGVIHGLKLVAVAVVAQAIVGMARTLTPDLRRAAVAVIALAALLLFRTGWMQLAVIALGALAGLALFRRPQGAAASPEAPMLRRRTGIAALLSFALLLTGAPLVAVLAGSERFAQFAAVYRSGALVFGGGHVVLPLLQAAVVDPGWISQDRFLAGYGLAQAMPGPLFTFAAFLGAAMDGLAGAALATLAIFLPGFLILIGTVPFWERLRTRPAAMAATQGANAAVVGVLGAAFVGTIVPSAVFGPLDVAIAVAGIAVLMLRTPPIALVLAGALAGLARSLLF